MLGFLRWAESLMEFVSQSKSRAEDFVDRLNYRVTVSILLFCAVGIFMKDYGGSPLQCWGRAEWKNSWIEYAHDYCFIESTYFIPMSDPRVPNNKDMRRKAQLDYYQWVPFVLMLQAASYILPELFWKTVSWFSGFHVGTLLDKARGNTLNLKGIREHGKSDTIDVKEIDKMSMQINHALMQKHKANTINPFNPFTGLCKVSGSLTMIYFFTKVLLILNSCAQFYFLGFFLGKNNHFFGWDAVGALTNGDAWRDSGLFPRVTLCDFQVRGIRNKIENYTVQCVLMGNMINEKIFIALWWWMLLLATITTINLAQWIWLVCFQHNRKSFVMETIQSSAHILYPLPKLSKKKEKEAEAEKEKAAEKKEVDGGNETGGTADSDQGSVVQSYSDQATAPARSETSHAATPALSEEEKKEKEERAKREKERRERHTKFDNLLALSERKDGFVKYLGMDGVLITELITRNSNSIVASAVLGKVFEKYAKTAEDSEMVEFYAG